MIGIGILDLHIDLCALLIVEALQHGLLVHQPSQQLQRNPTEAPKDKQQKNFYLTSAPEK